MAVLARCLGCVHSDLAQFRCAGALMMALSVRAGIFSAATAANSLSAMPRSSAPAPMRLRCCRCRTAVNRWIALRLPGHRGGRGRWACDRRSQLPVWATRLLLRAGDARLRGGAAHPRQRRPSLAPGSGYIPKLDVRPQNFQFASRAAFYLDRPGARGARCSPGPALSNIALRRLSGGDPRKRGRRAGARRRTLRSSSPP